MNTYHIYVKLSLEINEKIILKAIPTVQSYKELMQYAISLCHEQNRYEQITVNYLDSDKELIDVADDSDLKFAYDQASEKKIKFNIQLPKMVSVEESKESTA
jgi:hypothetical protein